MELGRQTKPAGEGSGHFFHAENNEQTNWATSGEWMAVGYGVGRGASKKVGGTSQGRDGLDQRPGSGGEK